jgi:4a-hydroxytetrahydrobiopterin dehydratase
MAEKYGPEQLAMAAGELPGWQVTDGNALSRGIRFKDHIEAMGFVVRVAMVAETMDHHPELRIVYNTVDIRLSTHDAGGVTEKDVRLAGRINALL